MKKHRPEDNSPKSYGTYRSIWHELKLIFYCLTAIPIVVFAFIYFRLGALNTVLPGLLVVLALILILEGFILFRRIAEHIEGISSTMTQAIEGRVDRVQGSGETKELVTIANTFNQTLSKLEETAKELGIRAVQSATLSEITEIISTSIDLEEIGKVVLARTLKAVNSQAGYLAVKKDDPLTLNVAASFGISGELPDRIDLDAGKTLAGLVASNKSPISIEDIEQDPHMKGLNLPDIGFSRLLYLSIVAKGSSIGVLVLGRDKTRPHFGDEEIQFLQTLLHQVAYSIENARLYENLRGSNRELEKVLEFQGKAQDQLLASARMAAFGELSVTIAHELNNPLTGILGYTDLILRSSMDKKQTKEMMEKIRAQAIRASKITGNLLDFVNIEPGSRIDTDLNGLVKKALLLTERRMLEGGIHLDLKLADKISPVVADPAQMGQVFFSLVSNALNSMKRETNAPQGLISIQSGERGDKVYVSFKDTGPGISPERLSKIFEPFNSTQNKMSQVGLGLWVSNRIVEAHGGVIRVESVLGKGNTFVVILPAA